MKTKRILLLSIFLFLVNSLQLFSNNILVDNVSLEGQVASEDYVYVEFDLSWNNSWRTVAVPDNWDAAWVFIKYSVAGGPWQHATLDTVDFYGPYGSAVDVSQDSVGAFIYRSNNGSGSVNYDNIRLRWEYGIDGVADDAYLDVKVFAIEMVYIPEGEFYIGDGAQVIGRFQDETTETPFLVSSEDAINFGSNPGELELYGETFFPTSMPAEYPKGFKSLYCMKYEVSQEQFVEFLNTLTRTQQETRTYQTLSTLIAPTYVFTANNNIDFPRNGIWCDTPPAAPQPVEFSCYLSTSSNEVGDGESLPTNNLTWMDVAAYLDWSGLRPMTELEFEKICRGPNTAVTNEYPWGTTNIYSTLYTLSNKGLPNESIDNPGSATGNAAYSTATASRIVRCGIFAASATNTRQETGATYYGVMEMGGNVNEMVVTAQQNSGLYFSGVHGDGTLTPSGDANEDYWPGINGLSNWLWATEVFGGTTGVTTGTGAGFKGGCANSSNQTSHLETSDRSKTRFNVGENRIIPFGIRGIRTAD